MEEATPSKGSIRGHGQDQEVLLCYPMSIREGPKCKSRRDSREGKWALSGEGQPYKGDVCAYYRLRRYVDNPRDDMLVNCSYDIVPWGWSQW